MTGDPEPCALPVGTGDDLRAENAWLRDQVVKLQRKLEQLASNSNDAEGSESAEDLKPGGEQPEVSRNRETARALACLSSFDMEHGLTADMVRRYSRQVLLPSFGVRGTLWLLFLSSRLADLEFVRNQVPHC